MPRVRCPACNAGRTWALATGQRRCSECRKTLRTAVPRFRASRPYLHDLARMFCLGVPAYRLRHQYEGKLGLAATERAYRTFREFV